MTSNILKIVGVVLSTARRAVPPKQIAIPYAIFLTSALAVSYLMANFEASVIITLSGMSQCFGIFFIGMQLVSAQGATGVSARALFLNALAFGFRLSSSTWLQGYLPMDMTGDGFYQAVDIGALAVSLALLGCMRFQRRLRSTYQATEDSFPVIPLILAAGTLAAGLHGDLDARPVFDALWMTGLILHALAVVPQLWMVRRAGGHEEPLMSHHVAAMAVGQVLSAAYFYHARDDILFSPWVEGVNHAVGTILVAHALHLLLVCGAPSREDTW